MELTNIEKINMEADGFDPSVSFKMDSFEVLITKEVIEISSDYQRIVLSKDQFKKFIEFVEESQK